MLKAFVVDDENWVVESIKRGVNWNKCGFELAGWAFGGRKALEEIERIMPDVVITDIRMPDMDGIDLIRRIRKFSQRIQLIIVSGFAEFEYAKECLMHGAVGYCLKPIDEEELEAYLRKAAENLSKSKPWLDYRLLELLSDPSSCNEKVLSKVLDEYGLAIDSEKNITLSVVIGEEQPIFEPCTNFVPVSLGRNKTVYLISHARSDSEVYILSVFEALEESSIGYGGQVGDYCQLAGIIEDSVLAAYQYFITGKKSLYKIQIYNEQYALNEITKLRKKLTAGSISAAINLLERVPEYFRNIQLGIQHAYYLYIVFFDAIGELVELPLEKPYYDYQQLAEEFNSIDAMVGFFKKILEDRINKPEECDLTNIKNNSAKQIIEYVKANYRKDLSIQDLAARFYINPSYMSHLFSKETGETFSRYLNRLRINYACELLKKTEMPVGEVAAESGYNDYFHFCKVFRKIMGKTPSQIRGAE